MLEKISTKELVEELKERERLYQKAHCFII